MNGHVLYPYRIVEHVQPTKFLCAFAKYTANRNNGGIWYVRHVRRSSLVNPLHSLVARMWVAVPLLCSYSFEHRAS